MVKSFGSLFLSIAFYFFIKSIDMNEYLDIKEEEKKLTLSEELIKAKKEILIELNKRFNFKLLEKEEKGIANIVYLEDFELNFEDDIKFTYNQETKKIEKYIYKNNQWILLRK